MSNLFFIADTHFGHANILKFESGYRAFATIEEHDEYLVQAWNETVGPRDVVWHLGDVFLGRKEDVGILARLNGRKRLVAGNHDTPAIYPYFEDVHGIVPFRKGIVLSHVPLHPESARRWKLNLHGHLHSSKLMKIRPESPQLVPDPQYLCVSAEQQPGLRPKPWDEVRAYLAQHVEGAE